MIRILQSKIATGGLVLVIGWLGISAIRISKEKEQTSEQVSNMEEKMATLEKENAHLEKLLVYLQNPEFIARQVRARLNYKSADEEVAYVYLEEKKPVEAGVLKEEAETSFLAKAKDWLYNLFH